MEGYIHYFAADEQIEWVKWLLLQNGGIILPSIHHKNDPIYGTLWLPSITYSVRDSSKVQVVEDHMEHQQQVLQLLKENLNLHKSK